MKTAIICAICTKPKKESDSYLVRITDYRMENMKARIEDEPYVYAAKTRVCRTCVKRMGYKTRKDKKK